MKKIFSSRWIPVLVGGVLFIATMIGLTFVTGNLIGKNEEIQQLVKDLEAARSEKARPDTNGTDEDLNLADDAETDDKKKYDEEKQAVATIIDNSFRTINDMSDPGELKFDNPALPPLMDALARQRDYLRNRELDLIELEAHINEQLQELHW